MPNTTSPNDRNPSSPSTKPLQLISQEDDNKFFSRLLSKETSSIASSSFRVYYGGVVGSVPFGWESQPGTPKHAFFRDNLSGLPPLTPPPSSFRSTTSDGRKPIPRKSRRPGPFLRLLRRIGMVRRPSSTSSLSGFVPIKPMDYRWGRSRFSSGGSFDSIDPVDDEEEEERAEAARPVSCFGIGRRNGAGPRGCHGW